MDFHEMAVRPSNRGEHSSSGGKLAFLLVIAFACLAAYWPAKTGQFLWDDDAHVTKPELRSMAGLSRVWFEIGATQQYYPLLHSLFWVEWQLWGDNPVGYHLANLVLHALAAWLVFLILRKLAIPGAILAAGIFALHPVQVESVAWITEQKNTFSAVFYLSAMLVYLDYDKSRKTSSYFWALALFVLGLLSKTVTATLPAALLVIFWWQRGRLSWRRDIQPLMPFFVLGACSGLLTAWVERKWIGAEGVDFDFTLLQRLLLSGRVIWFYFGKLFWPANLTFIYPRWQIDPTIWWQWLYLAAAMATTIALWLFRKRSRGPLAGWLFFVGTLFPVLGFFNVFPFMYSFVADHFQYLASLGIVVPFSAGLAMAARRLPRPRALVAGALGAALLVLLGVLTSRQCEMYSDRITLYQTTIERNPECWLAYNNLGAELVKAGRPQDAIDTSQEAVRVKADNPVGYTNLGVAMAKLGQAEKAIEQYRRALEINPNYAIAHFNLANALARAGKFDEAIAEYEEALRLRPEYILARNSLAFTLLQTGKSEEAVRQLEEVLKLSPDSPRAYFNLGSAFSMSGRPERALQEFEHALKLDPLYAEACANLAAVHADMHQPTQALAAGEKALELARHRGDPKLIETIEKWLTDYRAKSTSSAPAEK